MVALEEVGHFAFAHLRVAELASGGGSAEGELATLLSALVCALVGVDQLLDAVKRDILRVRKWYTYVDSVSIPCIFKVYNY